MTAKEYLQPYRSINMKINAKLEEISRLRSIAEKATARISGDRVMTSASEGMAKTVERMVDLENEVDDMVDSLSAIEDILACVDDDKLQVLLRYRYKCGLTWQEVADRMGYKDVRPIYRWHNEALKKVETVIESHVT